ncbi:protein kinase [Nocardiopsis sp. NPDC049922]|uniref:serine/threonine-protein kinase n=1 Tax=Nocardiopsis sp. NPDC049922 TaxID=3155157 RepID=UPI0033D2B019
MSAYEPSDGPGGLTGTVLSSRYRLEEQVGSGGMGAVWRATDTLLNRPVAVKLLHPSQMAEPTARQRFRTEGRIAAGLSHPGIAQVYDYGEEDGRAFLIMELVVGVSLSQVLREQGRLSPDQTLDFVCQSAQALAAAHARGVVHRDIKPGNLLVTGEGQIKLTDFGIARGDMSVTLTQTGMVMGTAQYISPEQASGRPASSASDLYALGVVAYECLAGQPPFTGDNPVALALAHTRDEPPELPDDIPADIDDLVSALLLKDPEERPASASEVAHMAAVIRSNAGTGPLTPSAGFGSVARTAVVGAVPDTGSGPVRRRTADQQTVSPGEQGDSVRLSEASQRRIRLPVVLAVVVAAFLVAAAVVAGFLYGGPPEADPVRETVEPPASSGSPAPAPSEAAVEGDGTEQRPVEDEPGTGWNTQPEGNAQEEEPAPEDGEQTDGATGEPTAPDDGGETPPDDGGDPVDDGDTTPDDPVGEDPETPPDGTDT